MNIGILGYGEIGKAVHEVYKRHAPDVVVFRKDLTFQDDLTQVHILNVCIPYKDLIEFSETVVKTANELCAKIVIVHSTVAVGTIALLKIKMPDVVIAHSPVRGVHPNLYDGIMTFTKFVGATTRNDAKIVSNHLSDLGIKTHICANSATSELAKLLDTTYYGLCIAFHGEANRACEKFGANFEETMTLFNQTYNAGYSQLGKNNVVRPVLAPPTNGIGGHCVVQNAELLEQRFQSKCIDIIKEYKKA